MSTEIKTKQKTGRIYKIVCACGCDKLYIGKTTQTLSCRMSAHKSSARNGNNLPLYKHMREEKYVGFSIVLLETCDDMNNEELNAREHLYMMRFNTVKTGFNNIHGTQFCTHGIKRYDCLPCKGSNRCIHGVKAMCLICKGSQACKHNRRRFQCVDCKGSMVCIHKRQKGQCSECRNQKYICTGCNQEFIGNLELVCHGFDCTSKPKPEI